MLHLRDGHRLDRLLLLLDTGSSTSVRTTAAKQLAQLAVKSVISDVAIVEDDIKTTRQHVGAMSDSAAWSELMSVVARVCHFSPSRGYQLTLVAVRFYHIYIQNRTRLALRCPSRCRKYSP